MAEQQAADTQANRDLREGIKLSFEFFKHLTTLAGAGVVALVAVYQEQILDKRLLLVAVATLGISAAIALVGLSYAMEATRAFTTPAGPALARTTFKYVTYSGGTFTWGLTSVVGASIRLTIWQLIIVSIVIGLVLAVIIRAR